MCTGSRAINHKTHVCTHRIPMVSYLTPGTGDQVHRLTLSDFGYFPQQIACIARLKGIKVDNINSDNPMFSQSDYKDYVFGDVMPHNLLLIFHCFREMYCVHL